ncbi:MAG: hypothetical protein WDN45_14725 [Caulobacteraceae bacterium]
MKTCHLLVAAAALSIGALAGAAHAQDVTPLDAKTVDSWHAVDLGLGVSLDVPTAVGDSYRPTNKEDAGMALFRVAVTDAGEMTCGLDRLNYNVKPLAMARTRGHRLLLDRQHRHLLPRGGHGRAREPCRGDAVRPGLSGLALRGQLQRPAGRPGRGRRDLGAGGGGAGRALRPDLHH